jgi:hypothetical protein
MIAYFNFIVGVYIQQKNILIYDDHTIFYTNTIIFRFKLNGFWLGSYHF